MLQAFLECDGIHCCQRHGLRSRYDVAPNGVKKPHGGGGHLTLSRKSEFIEKVGLTGHYCE